MLKSFQASASGWLLWVVGLGRYLAEGGAGLEMLVGKVGVALKGNLAENKCTCVPAFPRRGRVGLGLV